jgi:translocation and assembly module TamA
VPVVEPAPVARAEIPLLEVVAPDQLRALLQRHLDLARAIADQTAAAERHAEGTKAPADLGIEITEVEWARLAAAAPAQARSLLQTEGYFAAEAQVERVGRVVRLRVEPGPIARVDKLVIDVQGELGAALERRDPDARTVHAELMADWPLQVGAPFRNADWAEAKTAVVARLRALGYAAASWSGTSAEVHEGEPPSVRIFGVVDSGPLFLAGAEDDIVVEGLVYQDADRVRALAGFGRGIPLTEIRLLDYQERLLRTGLFDQVAVSLDPDAAAQGRSRLLVQLKEAPRQAATVGVGYSANTGPRVTLEHVHRRLFGFAATARNKFEVGRDKQAWDGEISSHPNARMERYLVGGTVERLLTSSDLVLSQRLRAGRAEDLPGLERLAFVEGEHAKECARDGSDTFDCLNLRALSLNLHHTWRRLDNALLPTRGYTLNLQVGGGRAIGSAPWMPQEQQPLSGPFARVYGRVTGYLPFGDQWHTEARIELGGVLTKDRVVVPDSQRFRAGGDESVRGYPYRTLAPLKVDGSVTGGKLLFTSSIEVAHPISRSLPSVWWAAFIDAGRAADSVSAVNDPSDPEGKRKLKGLYQPALGYGVGVRWRSPVGPLKLDLAWGEEVQRARVHLSVGIAY